MEELKYIIEDSTIAELLGVQNFTNAESAILELVKNAYDAEVLDLTIKFNENQLIIEDDGIGMNAEDIALTIHSHPSLSEVVMDTAELALGMPIHV